MKNRCILAAVLLCAATVLGWSQFYKDYDDATRKSLAEATWLAGRQYQAGGKTAKGAEYVDMAFHIWPGLDTSSISDAVALPCSDMTCKARLPDASTCETSPGGRYLSSSRSSRSSRSGMA